MKSLAVLSLFASLAIAQNSSTTPAGLSTGCSNFYDQLNSNTDLSGCLKPVISATAPFTGSSSSSSAITSALNIVCSSSNTCSPSVIQGLLGQFYQACQSELTISKNPQVTILYDSLYLFGPLQLALCQKDSSGNFCVSSQSSKTTKRASFDRRDAAQDSQKVLSLFNSGKNIAFLGLLPDLSADQLCTSCTREVMNGYITQLTSVPYGPGLPNSLLFSGEPTLYKAINDKCGASFLSGEVQAAGGLATGAAPRSVDGGFALVGSAIAAAAAGAVALL